MVFRMPLATISTNKGMENMRVGRLRSIQAKNIPSNNRSRRPRANHSACDGANHGQMGRGDDIVFHVSDTSSRRHNRKDASGRIHRPSPSPSPCHNPSTWDYTWMNIVRHTLSLRELSLQHRTDTPQRGGSTRQHLRMG